MFHQFSKEEYIVIQKALIDAFNKLADENPANPTAEVKEKLEEIFLIQNRVKMLIGRL